MSLSERAMLVGLHLSMWNGRRIDRAATKETLQARDAEADAGTFHKLLVPKEALQPIEQAHGKARRLYYKLTLPWGETQRILQSKAFFDYLAAMSEQQNLCEQAYTEFLRKYPDLVLRAPERLGKLFNASQFPTVEELQHAFRFHTEILPISESGDFRVDLGDSAVADKIRESIAQQHEAKLEEARATLMERVREPIAHAIAVLKKPKAVLKESLLRNIQQEMLWAPKLALADDPQLTQWCDAVRLRLLDVSLAQVRRSPTRRAGLVSDLQHLLAEAP